MTTSEIDGSAVMWAMQVMGYAPFNEKVTLVIIRFCC